MSSDTIDFISVMKKRQGLCTLNKEKHGYLWELGRDNPYPDDLGPWLRVVRNTTVIPIA